MLQNTNMSKVKKQQKVLLMHVFPFDFYCLIMLSTLGVTENCCFLGGWNTTHTLAEMYTFFRFECCIHKSLWNKHQSLPDHNAAVSIHHHCHKDLVSHIKYNHLTSLLTPGSRVLLEKLTSSKLITKFPTFYGTPKFITVFTNACHPSLSWASSI